MKQDLIDRYLDLLREQTETEMGESMISRILHLVNDRDAEALVEELEDMAEYPDYLSESEAREIVGRFENFDGSRGAHWRDPQAMFNAVEAMGFNTDCPDHYNRWAWYAVMNMVWSDEWGVLRDHVNASEEVRIIAELARARLMDKDKAFNVRYYFRVD